MYQTFVLSKVCLSLLNMFYQLTFMSRHVTKTKADYYLALQFIKYLFLFSTIRLST